MSLATLYSGPGKVYFQSKSFQADGENGAVQISVQEPTTKRASAMFGHMLETLDSQHGEVSVSPFDNWSLLPLLFPVQIGASTLSGANAAALLVGWDPHTATKLPLQVWTPDGRAYNAVRAAITQHPSLKLGNGQPLYGPAKFTLLGDPALSPGGSGFLFSGSTVTETGASDPGGAMTLSDFQNGTWTGTWGTVAGFGNDGTSPAMQAEDYWTVQTEAKYDMLTVQKCVRKMKLASARFMVRARLVGPQHSQLVARISTHTLGQTLGSAALTLTGPSGRTVTLNNCEVVGAGFEFGGTKLGTGEIGFVTAMTFNAGAPGALIAFSS